MPQQQAALDEPQQVTTPLSIDFGASAGRLKPINGVNGGPWVCGSIDLRERHRAIAPAFARLHDCNYPACDVIDILAIFPDASADPDDPASYDFPSSDDYIEAIREIGAEVVFRLGASIDHRKHPKRNHPPADFGTWARICVNIVRHYNEGWAEGHRWDIRYWEIWNEPDHPKCWSGTPEQYLDLYRITSLALRAHFPDIKIGGPGACSLRKGLTRLFLERCRNETLPLDFFTWHRYAQHPKSFVEDARLARALLDEHGFEGAESHCNEWNYVADSGGFQRSRSDRDYAAQLFGRVHSAEGQAFIGAALCNWQHEAVDGCCFYSADRARFSCFDEFWMPRAAWYSLKAFATLTLTPDIRVAVGHDSEQGLGLLAGLSEDRLTATVFLANFAHPATTFSLLCQGLPWRVARVRAIIYDDDATTGREAWSTTITGSGRLRIDLPAPGIALLELVGEV